MKCGKLPKIMTTESTHLKSKKLRTPNYELTITKLRKTIAKLESVISVQAADISTLKIFISHMDTAKKLTDKSVETRIARSVDIETKQNQLEQSLRETRNALLSIHHATRKFLQYDKR